MEYLIILLSLSIFSFLGFQIYKFIKTKDLRENQRQNFELLKTQKLLQIQKEVAEEREVLLEAVQRTKEKMIDNITSEIRNEQYKRTAQLEKDFIVEINKMQEKLDKNKDIFKQQELLLINRLEELKSTENAARNARIREYEENNLDSFYSISLSSTDLFEIEQLNEIIPKLRNPIPLRKAIFEVYYKIPTKDMIQKITKGNRITGIYKITLKKTGECYVGQSVDIGNRWIQHIKRGLGVEELTNSKLYPAMLEHGVHNFSFEIIEEVDAAKLGQQEKYWAEYFGSKIFGFSIKN